MHFTEAQDIFTVVDINLHGVGRTCIKLFSSLVKKNLSFRASEIK